MDSVVAASSYSASGNYTGIGFERTTSLHFEELKKDQEFLMGKARELRKAYSALRVRNEAWEERKERKREEAAAKGLNLSSYWEMTDDEFDEDMTLTAANMNFCQDRYNLVGMARAWMQEGANQLAIFPGFDFEGRAKRVVDLTNLLKKYIKATKPLGEDENEEAKEWLDKVETKLPRAAPDFRPLKDRLRLTKLSTRTRFLESSRAASPAGDPLRTSTPEAVRGGKKKGKKDVEAPKSNLESVDASSNANPECPVRDAQSGVFNPSHICVAGKDVRQEEPLEVKDGDNVSVPHQGDDKRKEEEEEEGEIGRASSRERL